MNGPGTRRGAFFAAFPEIADGARLAFDELDGTTAAERSGATKRQPDAAGRFAQRLESEGLYVGHIRLRYASGAGAPRTRGCGSRTAPSR